MKIKAVPSKWMMREGLRLDVGPYLSGALEARVRLEELTARKDRLDSLTQGHAGGIYNGPQFKRNYVQDPEHGVPFVSSGSMLRADLSVLPLLRKKDAYSKKLSYLKLTEGTTLISCSGAIGRMVYVRPDMAGMWSSQDVMKVVPNPDKIPPGYLYAYLSSKFGVPLVVSGTYGAIIQHIEPHHIADLPVPRLGEALEREVHELVEEAATLRAHASLELRRVADRFDELISDIDLRQPSPRVSLVRPNELQARMDAQFHDPIPQSIRDVLREGPHTTIGELCPTIFLPGIFKRVHIDDPQFGAPYFTGASLFWLEPKQKGILSKKTKLFNDVFLEKGTILVQAFGQDGGLTGRSVWVGRHLAGATTTHMLVRLRTLDATLTAYLFGFLQSEAAYRQISVLTYGGSIPHLDTSGISTVVVPLLESDERFAIGERVSAALNDRDDALDFETKARLRIESAIEEAT